MQDVEEPALEPVKAKKKRKPKAKAEVRTDSDAARKASEAAALAREEALRKVEEEQQALREARAKQRVLEEEMLEKRKQVCTPGTHLSLYPATVRELLTGIRNMCRSFSQKRTASGASAWKKNSARKHFLHRPKMVLTAARQGLSSRVGLWEVQDQRIQVSSRGHMHISRQ